MSKGRIAAALLTPRPWRSGFRGRLDVVDEHHSNSPERSLQSDRSNRGDRCRGREREDGVRELHRLALVDDRRGPQGAAVPPVHGPRAFTFVLGSGRFLKGWDQSLVGMKVGGRRELVLPPDLAYGVFGDNDTIPGNATLIFDIDLVSVQ
jgi:FKBP-type peptidyl-prolyl cis-trans isomerase